MGYYVLFLIFMTRIMRMIKLYFQAEELDTGHAIKKTSKKMVHKLPMFVSSELRMETGGLLAVG